VPNILNLKIMEETGNIFFYQDDTNNAQIEVKLEDETVWLTQGQIVKLFQSSKANISEHIKQIFRLGELQSDSTVRNFRTVRLRDRIERYKEMDYKTIEYSMTIGKTGRQHSSFFCEARQ
jgi:hypothetical protein